MECKFLQTVEMPATVKTAFVTFGRVVGIHIDDGLIVDGRVDVCRARPIARMATWITPLSIASFEMIAPLRQGNAFAALAETSKNENS